MTGSFCSNCGAERVTGARFCASCGGAFSPVSGGHAAGDPTPGPQQHVVPPVPQPLQPVHGEAPAPPPYAAGPPYTGQQPPGQEQPAPQQGWTQQQPLAGATAFAAPGAPPAAAPWGSATPSGAAPGRSVVDTLLNGDWAGAARIAGTAVGAMLAVSLIGMLLLTEGGVGFRETVALIFAGACLAVGGDAYAEAGIGAFGSSGSIGVLPLTVTFVGVGLLGWLFARYLRNRPASSATEGLLQGVRIALIFTVAFLPLSLLTRFRSEDDTFGLTGRVGISVISTIFGALLFAIAGLGLAWFLSRGTVLPGRVTAVRDRLRAPLAGAVAVFGVGVLAVVVALIYGLIEESEKLVQVGMAILGLGNGALGSVLLSAGVPLNAEGSSSVGELSPSGSDSFDLLTITDESAWFWLAPVVLLAAMVLVATALAVRQNTIEDARREGLRFAGALAGVAFAATLLLRVGIDGEADEFSSSASGSVAFNPLVAAVLLALWGASTGLLAPAVAAKMPAGFVVAVRNAFGVAAEPPSSPAAGGPHPGHAPPHTVQTPSGYAPPAGQTPSGYGPPAGQTPPPAS
jgi:hypothetical protein